MQADTELLRRYAEQDDEQAFAELVQRHLSIVYNAALRRTDGNTHFAEEAAQLVFTQLACKARRLVRHPALLAWLHTSTRFAAADLIRRERRLAARQYVAHTMQLDDNASPDWEKLRPLIDDALDRLPPADRQAVLLRFFANRSFADIGGELNASENAARKRVDRALEHLRRHLSRRGVTTTSAALGLALATAPAHAAPAPTAAVIAATATANAVAAAQLTVPAAIVSFMSTAKFTTAVVTTIVAIGVASFSVGLVRWSGTQQQRREQIEALQRQISTFRGELRAEGRQRATSASARNIPSTTTTGAVTNLQRGREYTLKLLTSPAYAAVREESYRLRFRHEYGAFIESRHFTSEQSEMLCDAVTEYYHAYLLHLNESTLSASAMKNYRATADADQKRFFDSLSASFSESQQQDIRRCFDSQMRVRTAEDIGNGMAFAGVPMDRVQTLSLAMVLGDAFRAGGTGDLVTRKKMQEIDPQSGLTPTERRMLDDASVFLAPAQLSSFENYLHLQHSMNTAMARADEIMKQRGRKP